MSTDPVLFPCPRCGSSCGDVGNSCSECGWNPNAPTPEAQQPIKRKPASGGTGKHPYLMGLVVCEMLVCIIGWGMFAVAIAWMPPAGDMNFGHVAASASIFGGVILLACNCLFSMVVLAYCLKTRIPGLKIAGTIPWLVSLPGLFFVLSAFFQAL